MFVLLYKDEVKDTLSLVGSIAVYEEDSLSSKLAEMLQMAVEHASVTQPDYTFDCSNFFSTRKAASEDEDYKYQVVTFD